MINRFFTALNPGNKAKLTAFLADSFIIKRSNLTSEDKTTYLTNYPTYENSGILVNSAAYAHGEALGERHELADHGAERLHAFAVHLLLELRTPAAGR